MGIISESIMWSNMVWSLGLEPYLTRCFLHNFLRSRLHHLPDRLLCCIKWCWLKTSRINSSLQNGHSKENYLKKKYCGAVYHCVNVKIWMEATCQRIRQTRLNTVFVFLFFSPPNLGNFSESPPTRKSKLQDGELVFLLLVLVYFAAQAHLQPF